MFSGWKDVIKMGAISCVKNRDACAQQNITSVPTLKFFHANSSLGSNGTILENIDGIENIKRGLIQNLENQQRAQGVPPNQANIIPYG